MTTAIKYHLEHRVTVADYDNIDHPCNFALQELSPAGEEIGGLLVPWLWPLHFTATAITVKDFIAVPPNETGVDYPQPNERVIRANLRPGFSDGGWAVSYSMLGASRTISNIQLLIEPIDQAEPEICTLVGGVSNTVDVLSIVETTSDWLVFKLQVRRDTFLRYEHRVLAGQVNEVVFTVGGVSGFYSAAAVGPYTGHVKVVTERNVHGIEHASHRDLPVLGEVREAELTMRRVLELSSASQT